MKKFIPVVLAACFLLTGCTGPFVLTQKVHEVQTGFDNKWVNEVAFLVCVILPVYGIATFADAVIFNSVEFWTGENPLSTASVPQSDAMCLRSVAAQM